MNRLVSSGLITVAIVVLAACSSGASGDAPEPSIAADALRIEAKDLVFSRSTLSAPASV